MSGMNDVAAGGTLGRETDIHAGSTHARRAGETLWGWGLRLEREGYAPGAISAYEQATDAGEKPQELRAVLRFAEVLERRGQHGAAEAAFRWAGESSEADVKAAAWRGIASYLMSRGEVYEGLAALQVIVDTGDPIEKPRALRNIGTCREDSLGDLEGARTAYEASIACGHPLHSVGARVNLAQLLDKQGDHSGAADLFRQAIDSGHPIETGRARVLLGMMLDEQGDEEQALASFEAGMADPDTEWGQRAAMSAGGIYLERRRQYDRAAEAFSIARHLPDRDYAAIATFLLGESEKLRGGEQAALNAYVQAARAEQLADASARAARCAAAKEAGMILVQRKEPVEAREFFRIAEMAENGEERARGACMLGITERQLGNRGAAVAAFERVLSTPSAPYDVRSLAERGLAEIS